MEYIKGRRTTDNIFILKTIADKYLNTKRAKFYWLFDAVVREVLWWKLTPQKSISTKFIEGLREV
jgi:hypothetical protein